MKVASSSVASILKRWGDTVVSPENRAETAARRPQAVRAIAHSIRRTQVAQVKQRRVAQSLALSFAAGAAIASGLLWRYGSPAARSTSLASSVEVLDGAMRVLHEGREQVATAAGEDRRVPLFAGDGVSTDRASRAHLTLANGAAIAIEPDASLLVSTPDGSADPSGVSVRLRQGTVFVDVPKLGPKKMFAVRTPDALVTVHGTSFSVAYPGPGHEKDGATKVTVREGTVSVRCDQGDGEQFVQAGGAWSCPAPAAAPASAAVASAARESSANDRERTASEARPGAPAIASPRAPVLGAKSSSDPLADQNRAFADALRARRLGNPSECVHLLDDFLSTYPTSPLRQEATVERFRALENAGDHAAAARAALLYLAAYPSGFAADEARKLGLSAVDAYGKP